MIKHFFEPAVSLARSKTSGNSDGIKTLLIALQKIVSYSPRLYYSVFQGFSKAKSANGGSISSWSQFLILPQLPQKIKLASKVVKVDSKIIILLPKI
jgi:hypothetical protein